jgi:hypothetical protein
LALGAAAGALYWAGWAKTAATVGATALYSAYRWGSYYYGRGNNPPPASEKKYQISLLYSQRWKGNLSDYGDDHTTIGLIVDGQLQSAWGFWVDSGEFFPIYIGKGVVRDDTKKYKGDRRRHKLFDVTREQFENVCKVIERERRNPPRFDTTHNVGYSCTTWAHHVLREGAGITVENPNWVFRAYPGDIEDQMEEPSMSYWDNRHQSE